MHIKGYLVAPADLAEVVKQWQITSAVIDGQPGCKFSDALKIQSELNQAGVQNVTIAEHSDD
jgi:biopolymer transport protein ExbD